MKILHTSDWHLGHTLYNHDRTEEHLSMIEQITGITAAEQPDVFLLCGDVFHTSQPSSTVHRMLEDAIIRIREANPGMTVIITAGNHDSAAKHEIFRTPWRTMNVHTIGSINQQHPEEHIIEVPGKGYVAAIPYCHERNMPDGFRQRLLDIAAEMNSDSLPIVMTDHTTVRGCDFTGHDRANEYTAGGIDATDILDMGQGYDYLALGHIHHEQFVHTGKHNVRYAGTPIPVSFDENYPHSVSIVEIDHHGSTPTVRRIEITNPKPLVTLPIEGYAKWEDAKRLLADFQDDIPAYIRLSVEVDDFLPVNAHAEATAIVSTKRCSLCHINTIRRCKTSGESKAMSVAEFQAEDPLKIAIRYAEDTGIEFDNEMQELFAETIRMIETEDRNQ